MNDDDLDRTRRSFLDRVLKVAAAAGVASAAPWAATAVGAGQGAAGDRGRALIQNIAKTRNCTVAAICDNYAPNLAKGRALVGAGVRAFSDHRAMLDARGLDALVAPALSLGLKYVLSSNMRALLLSEASGASTRGK